MINGLACLLASLLGQPLAASARAPTAWHPPDGFVEQRPAGPVASNSDFSFERRWTRPVEGWTEYILQAQARRPLSLRRYLARWRENHGCTLAPLRAVPSLGWAGKDQRSFSGTCEGGDAFVMHLARLGNTFFEFHVGRRLGHPPTPESGTAVQVLRRLLAELHDPRASITGGVQRPKRPIPRAEARRRLANLPMVRASGTRVRLRPLADAADIGPGGCTGSAGECLYWFRVESGDEDRWRFWRLLGFCPYDGKVYLSTTPDAHRAQGGFFWRLGERRPRDHGEKKPPKTLGVF